MTAAERTARGAAVGPAVLFCALSLYEASGAIEQFNRRLLQAAEEPGAGPARLVAISLRDAPARQSSEGVTLHGCGNSWTRFLARFLGCLLRERPSVVIIGHIELAGLAFLARLLRPRAATALLVHGAEAFWQRRPRRYEAWLVRRRVDAVVAASHFTATMLRREYRLAGNICVLPQPHAEVAAPGGGAPPRLVAVARQGRKDQGVWQIIRTLPDLRRAMPGLECDVVGGGPELPQFARALGFDAPIRFHAAASMPGLAALCRDAAATLLPLPGGGFGVVGRAAWATQVPRFADGSCAVLASPDAAALAMLIDPAAPAATPKGDDFADLLRRLALPPERRRRNPEPDPEPRRILVYRLGSIGDFVVALPCLHALRRRYPAARIRLLTNSPAEGRAAPARLVLDGSGLVDEHASYSLYTRKYRELAEIRRSIRAFAPDLTVYLTARRGLFEVARDWLFLRWSGAYPVIGLPFRRALRRSRPPAIGSSGLWEAEADHLARCLAALGPIDTARPENWDLRLRPAENARAERLLRQHIPGHGAGRLLGLSIGTKQAVKDWGDDNWRAVLQGLDLRGFALALVGGADDRERSAAVAAGWPGPVVNGCGRLSPRESAALIAHTELFLCHDSGPMHLAAAVGTPCVAVFSTHNRPGQWYPFGRGHRVLYPSSGDASIRSIAPGEVIAAVREALAGLPRSQRGAA